MNQLKSFLRGDIDWVDPSIIKQLEIYDTIQVDSTMYQTADIIKRIQQQGCPHCLQLRTEVTALKFQLKKVSAPEVPPMNLLLEKFFQGFQRIREREYSRKQLFKEVNIYLREFQLQILYTTDSAWRYFIQEVIKDTNKSNYRKLKIRRKVPGGNEV